LFLRLALEEGKADISFVNVTVKNTEYEKNIIFLLKSILLSFFELKHELTS
jgi:hypothetical protein